MKKHIHQLIVMASIAVAAAGCASAPSRFYTLNSTATATTNGLPAASYSVAIGPVTVPAVVDHAQFTVQVEPNRVKLEEFNRWAEPLNQNIASVVAGDLAALLGTSQVAAGPLANFQPDYSVSIRIQRFDTVPGQSVLVEALWVIHKTAGGASQSGHTIASETVTNSSFDALAAAHSRALAKVSADIAAAIRSQADAR
jgi:uncharacterized lipoprotein YmbA